ncbi:hypothetical protein [Nocardioides sp. Leaf285]|uniref:hypothetical protein n=1 Tax=Nocardioides sp. Leaf285 TaxID=1736322 RepID=UPI000703104F|nr:hypothetical protein [Nocardioides sp. Leaf285]KQP63097.1 hypothetical protein ASF47_18980 [Nocardioides sp. Leaf285]
MSTTASAREAARHSDGRFGAQNLREADVDLGPALKQRRAAPTPVDLDRAEWRQTSLPSGQQVRAVLVGSHQVASVTYTVLGADDEWGSRENAIEVGYMLTDEAYRGLGLNRTLLRSLAADHPGKTFYTENFERPVARRAWEDALGEASGMESDGDFGCRWCCIQLCEPDEHSTDPSLCGACGQRSLDHAQGLHTAALDVACWACDEQVRKAPPNPTGPTGSAR